MADLLGEDAHKRAFDLDRDRDWVENIVGDQQRIDLHGGAPGGRARGGDQFQGCAWRSARGQADRRGGWAARASGLATPQARARLTTLTIGLA